MSIVGARKVFGDRAEYIVCVNTIDVDTAREHVGLIEQLVTWHDSSHDVPSWLQPYLDPKMAEGVAWKLAPVRLDENCHTLSLDNDVILWRLPESIREWLDEDDALLIAEDVRACHGKFARWCGPEPRNSGIRGLPPTFDAESRLQDLLRATGVQLESETDEQGLQVALVTREKHRVVTLNEVTISGYFRPHRLELGYCGAHFVGVNAKQLPFEWNGRPGEQYVYEYFDYKKPEVLARLAV
jgi:hypothetical protein